MRFLVILLLLAMVSCDPVTIYHQKMVNNTEYTIVGSINNYPDSVLTETVIIAPHSIQTLSTMNDISQVSQYQNCPNYTSFVFSVQDNDSLEVDLNIDNPDEWVFIENSRSKVSGGGECACEITLEESQVH